MDCSQCVIDSADFDLRQIHWSRVACGMSPHTKRSISKGSVALAFIATFAVLGIVMCLLEAVVAAAPLPAPSAAGSAAGRRKAKRGSATKKLAGDGGGTAYSPRQTSGRRLECESAWERVS